MRVRDEEFILSASELELRKLGWRTSTERDDGNELARWRLSAWRGQGPELVRHFMISYRELATARSAAAMVGIKLETMWAEVLREAQRGAPE